MAKCKPKTPAAKGAGKSAKQTNASKTSAKKKPTAKKALPPSNPNVWRTGDI